MTSGEIPQYFKRVNTPTIIQLDETESGAVSLQIILAYYGKFVPIAELRKACAVSRNGTSVSQVILAAESYGLECKAIYYEIGNFNKIPLPAILECHLNKLVVLEGYKKGKVYVNDPAYGQKVVSAEEFSQLFTGGVVLLSPGLSFTKSGKPYTFTSTLFKYIIPFKYAFILYFLTDLILIFLTMAFAACNQVFIDQILVNHLTNWAMGIMVALGLVIFFTSTITYIHEYIYFRLKTAISIRFGSDFIWKILKLPLSFYLQRSPGEIAYRMTLIETVCDAITGTIATSAISVVLISLYSVWLFYYDIVIGFTTFALALGYYGVMWWTYSIRLDSLSRFQAAEGKNNALSQSGIENIESLKAAGFESKFFSKWSGVYTNVLNNLIELGRRDVFLNSLPDFLDAFSAALITGIGVYRIIEGHITTGMFAAITIIFANFIKPLKNMVSIGANIQLFKVNVNRLDDVLNNEDDPIYHPKKDATFSEVLHTIVLDRVSFSFYPTSELIIRDLSFMLTTGKSIAVVGKSGCGKTTLAKLICRLFPVTKGNILVNGLPIQDIPYESLVSSIGYIDQEPFFFAGTIWENLTLLDETVSEQVVIRAAEVACIHEDILLFKDQYRHQVLEGGKNFSGGQRQRLEIARNLVKIPTFLIMDEATSALDVATEEKVMNNIRKLGMGLLVIAHRLSTIKNCDEIIVIENGTIVAQGTDEELMEVDNLYRHLIISEKL